MQLLLYIVVPTSTDPIPDLPEVEYVSNISIYL